MQKQKYQSVLEALNALHLKSDDKGYPIFNINTVEEFHHKIEEFDFPDFVRYTLQASSDSFWIDFFIAIHERFSLLSYRELINLVKSIDGKIEKTLFLGFLSRYFELDFYDMIKHATLLEEEKSYIIWFKETNESFFKKSERDEALTEKFLGVSLEALKVSGLKIMVT